MKIPKSKSGGHHVLVVEDDPRIGNAYRRSLEPVGHRCTIATSLADARRILRRKHERFAVALLDLNLPGGDGAELIPLLEQTDPGVAVAVLSAHLDAERTLELWGKTRITLPKPVGLEQLRETVARLADAPDDIERYARAHALAPRETEVLRSGLDGLSNDQIATALGCQAETVLTHWKRIYQKTGARGYRSVVAAMRQHSRFEMEGRGETPGSRGWLLSRDDVERRDS